MTACRICASALAAPDYAAPAPAMTSLSTHIDLPTEVSVCRACGHVQSPDLPDVQAFYDGVYRISLQSDDHDQLYGVEGGKPLFRTGHQAALLAALDLPPGAKVLDFGAAKATTLRSLLALRPDISPHVFDVSDDYRAHWAGWIAPSAQASYSVPSDWTARFDLITAHFVLEHVTDPVAVLRDLARCLAPGGQLFFTVPDPVGNPGDLLVVDHLNHFTPASLTQALHRAGLTPLSLRDDQFRGAHVVLAVAGSSAAPIASPDAGPVLALLRGWRSILTGLAAQLAAAGNGAIAIYGAGFYGALFAGLTGGRALCFLDRNPHLQGGVLQGLPILPPEDCPPVALVLAALNPARAASILPADAPWLPAGARVIYPGGAAE